MGWFKSKVEGSAFAKVASNQMLLDSAKGQLVALEAVHDKHTTDKENLSKQIDLWHVKLDNTTDSIKSLLEKL